MTIAVRLTLLIVLALVPPLALQAWDGLEQRGEREAELRAQALSETRAVQADVVRIAEGIRHLLVALAKVAAIRDGDTESCTSYLQEVVSQFSAYTLLAVNDTDGGILCSSAGALPGTYSNGTRAYHRRAMESGSFAIGDLVLGTVTNRRSIHFALPFRRNNGVAGGIVLASLDQDALARQLALAAPLPGAVTIVLDASGTVVAAALEGHPVTDAWVGQPAPSNLRAALRVSAPSAIVATAPDGIPRLFGALPPDSNLGGLTVAVGLDEARALAGLRTALWRNLIGLLLGFGLALVAGLVAAKRFVLSPLAHLARAAIRVGRGDLSARADLGRQARAMREVGSAFNLMAIGLARREQERHRVAAELRQANETLETRVADRTAALTQAVAALHAAARERSHAEEQLRQSQKMEAVGQLTGGIAHDFNNMLQAIGASLELVSRRAQQGRMDEVGRHLAGAQRTVGRAAALTLRLLAFARRQVLQPEAVKPDDLVSGMKELIGQTVGPEIIVDWRLHDGRWSVLCDPNQLESALLNLAINARDAMPGGGRLTITTADVALSAANVRDEDGVEPGEYVEISVCDTGTGMDERTRKHAFEPFFTTKPIGQGTGLGLSQLYGFARQSNGLARLESAQGAGTTVRLLLPRHGTIERSSRPATATLNQSELDGGSVVLFVENEAEIRSLAAQCLREFGYKVVEADNSSTALRRLRQLLHVDMLVTSVGLPNGLNGRQLADFAREHWPGLPVLFITDYPGVVELDQLAPRMEMIGKPLQIEELSTKVRQMLTTLSPVS